VGKTSLHRLGSHEAQPYARKYHRQKASSLSKLRTIWTFSPDIAYAVSRAGTPPGIAERCVELESVDEHSQRVERFFNWPVIIAAFLVNPVIVIEQMAVSNTVSRYSCWSHNLGLDWLQTVAQRGSAAAKQLGETPEALPT
jgi:hypothetical protein